MSDTSVDVMRIADLLAYQEHATVSREVMKTKGGTVTLFAFDADQGLSEHTAPFDAMVQVLDGAVEVVISGVPYRVETGHAIVMPANEPHALNALGRFKMLLTMLRE